MRTAAAVTLFTVILGSGVLRTVRVSRDADVNPLIGVIVSITWMLFLILLLLILWE